MEKSHDDTQGVTNAGTGRVAIEIFSLKYITLLRSRQLSDENKVSLSGKPCGIISTEQSQHLIGS